MQLVHGTIEVINVRVVDNSNLIYSLDSLPTVYTVVPVDPATDLDTTPEKYLNETCITSGMTAQPLINTILGGLWDLGKYRLYIIIDVGDVAGEFPKLGPFEFYVI